MTLPSGLAAKVMVLLADATPAELAELEGHAFRLHEEACAALAAVRLRRARDELAALPEEPEPEGPAPVPLAPIVPDPEPIHPEPPFSKFGVGTSRFRRAIQIARILDRLGPHRPADLCRILSVSYPTICETLSCSWFGRIDRRVCLTRDGRAGLVVESPDGRTDPRSPDPAA